jgi:hypothetical protein
MNDTRVSESEQARTGWGRRERVGQERNPRGLSRHAVNCDGAVQRRELEDGQVVVQVQDREYSQLREERGPPAGGSEVHGSGVTVTRLRRRS